MKTIFKYILDPDSPNIPMPLGATILTVRGQNNDVCIWAEVDTDEREVLRYFGVFGTGHKLFTADGGRRNYIGTAILCGGNLVLHVYEFTWHENPELLDKN